MTDPITTPAQMREAAALVERVAAAMWSAEAMRAALNVGHTRTPERFASWLCLAEAAIRALPVAEPEPLAVRVKPLVWTQVETYGGTVWDAIGSMTVYRIIPKPDGRYLLTDPNCEIAAHTLDEAQSAAEADHAARIRSQIDAVPAAQVRAEALEEAAKYHGNFLMTQTSLPVEKIVCSEEAIRALIEKETNE